MWASGRKIAEAAAGGTFVDRGDIAALDFSIGSGFTADQTWREADLTSIVPVTAKAVLLYFQHSAGAAGFLVKFKKKGGSDVYNVIYRKTMAATLIHYDDIIVALAGDAILDYWIQTSTVTCGIAIRGWWT